MKAREKDDMTGAVCGPIKRKRIGIKTRKRRRAQSGMEEGAKVAVVLRKTRRRFRWSVNLLASKILSYAVTCTPERAGASSTASARLSQLLENCRKRETFPVLFELPSRP